ncbi:MAG: DUF711 family protein [Anaerolineales bacterium]
MKIRSVTFFLDPRTDSIEQAGAAAAQSMSAFQQAGYEVQTTRLATTPFPQMLDGKSEDEAIAWVQQLEEEATAQGFGYTAIGPAQLDQPEWYSLIPRIILNTETVFCSAEMATRSGGLSLSAVQACAQIITELAPQDPNGFANLYFTSLANVDAGSPFFPGAYHSGGTPSFALATEAAGLAVSAFESAATLNEGLEGLKSSLRKHATQLAATGDQVGAATGFQFTGIDFSLAPFPEESDSLGAALERMGVPKAGMHGSLAGAAMLAAALDEVDFPRVGFSGLLFPQLEDSVLADRAAEGVLTVKDLLMYSAVCGTGLDTIPLPGDIHADELSPLLLDLAALALRLDKPLTARLMPVPGKSAGDATSFNFAFFANSKVMPLSAQPLGTKIVESAPVHIQPRARS